MKLPVRVLVAQNAAKPLAPLACSFLMLWLTRPPNFMSWLPNVFEKSSFQMKRSSWQAHAARLREDGRELRGDLGVERLPRRVRRGGDVVASARELELVDGGARKGARQLGRGGGARLVPVRAEGREARVAPEVARRVLVNPRLVDVAHHQVHLAGEVDVAADVVLARVDRLDRRDHQVDPVAQRRVREREELQYGEGRRAEAVRRDDVAGEGIAGERVGRGGSRETAAEVAHPLRRGRD